ncbi:MAG: SMI1/KNR4 family protein [Beijerinckiaceae bacterium]
MTFTAATFWLSDLSHPKGSGSLDPLKPGVVETAEAYFGIKLPIAYTDLLRRRNGGYTEGFVIPIKHDLEWYGGCLDVDHLNGVGAAPPQRPTLSDYEGLDIYMTPYMIGEWELPERQILLCGDGHTWISLDFRHGDAPVVTWLDTDPYNDQVIAASFDQFLDKLVLKSIAVDSESGELRDQFKLA